MSTARNWANVAIVGLLIYAGYDYLNPRHTSKRAYDLWYEKCKQEVYETQSDRAFGRESLFPTEARSCFMSYQQYRRWMELDIRDGIIGERLDSSPPERGKN